MSTTSSLLLLLANCISLIAFAQPTCNGTRNYTVGIKVSNIWYSGSGDDIFFTICNDNIEVTNTSNCQSQCLKWFEIQGGMQNRGDWYYFDYIDQPDIGTPGRFKLVTYENDQLCIEKVSIDGTKWQKDESSATDFQCMEVSDSTAEYGTACDVINITLLTSTNNNKPATFLSEFYETGAECIAAGINTTDKIVYPEAPIANGSRNYELSLTVSSVSWSGTSDDLYLRLCTDEGLTDCTQTCLDYINGPCTDDWFVFIGGVNEEGDTYKGYWNTKDIGVVPYAQIVTFGSDQFCLSRFQVTSSNPSLIADKEADSPSYQRDCIQDDTPDGCSWLTIDMNNNEFEDAETDNCALGITNNATSVFVTKYEFTFKLSEVTFCGAETPVFFIFCSPDGSRFNNRSCSSIYEIGAEMPDTGGTYTYTIDISDYKMFNTLQDITFFDAWSWEKELWCLSQFKINGVTADGTEIEGYSLDFTVGTVVMDTPVDGGQYCEGVRIYPQTQVSEEFSDGPQKQNTVKKCRWNAVYDQYGAQSVSEKSTSQTWLEWMNDGYNWIYICVGLIGLVCCCIICCAVLQHMKKKQQSECDETNSDPNRPWHGGNSAFYG